MARRSLPAASPRPRRPRPATASFCPSSASRPATASSSGTKPDNVSDQVYRLRLGQPVKFLAKVEGAAVETGGMKLDGEWYLALADDGTTGYIFSNQLQPWNAARGGDARPQGRGSRDRRLAVFALRYDLAPRLFRFDATPLECSTWPYTSPDSDFSPIRCARYCASSAPNSPRSTSTTAIERRDDGSYDIIPGGASFWFTKTGALVFKPAEADVCAGRAREGPRRNAARRPSSRTSSSGTTRMSRRSSPPRSAGGCRGWPISWPAGERFESETDGVLIATKSARFTWVGVRRADAGHNTRGSRRDRFDVDGPVPFSRTRGLMAWSLHAALRRRYQAGRQLRLPARWRPALARLAASWHDEQRHRNGARTA